MIENLPQTIPSFKDPWKSLNERQRLESYTGKGVLSPELHIVGHLDFREALKEGLGPAIHEETHEIVYLTRGKAKWWIDNHAHDAKAGDLILIPKGKLHWGEGFTLEPIASYWLRLIQNPHKKLPDLAPEQSREIFDLFLKPTLYTFPAVPEIEQPFTQLMEEHRRPTVYSSSVVRALLHQILFMVLRSYRLATEMSPIGSSLSLCDSKIATILKYIQENLSKNPSLEEIASYGKMTPHELRTIFRQKVHMTPSEYQDAIKLNLAKTYLHDPKKTVTWIAMELGFNSSQYFATFFHKFSGNTPSEFRKYQLSPQSQPLPQKPLVIDP